MVRIRFPPGESPQTTGSAGDLTRLIPIIHNHAVRSSSSWATGKEGETNTMKSLIRNVILAVHVPKRLIAPLALRIRGRTYCPGAPIALVSGRRIAKAIPSCSPLIRRA